MTADALPTVQINGVVWSQVVVGNTVYAAGQFSRARPAGAAAGTQETARGNLLAYDIRTGELITSFAPSLNAQALVVAASPDGSRIYVGGDFTQADGQPRNRVAAYSTSTGELIGDFRPSVSNRVRAIAATNDTVYLGGNFAAVGSVSRNRLAAVSAVDGALLPWAPQPGVGSTDGNRDGNLSTSNEVMALVLTGGGAQVVAAGRFDSLNEVKATGVGALDPVSAETRPFAVNQLITNQGINAAIWSLSTDGTTVYGTGYDYFGPGNLEGSFAADADGGTVQWINDCRGDSYSSFPVNGALYAATHAHDCKNIGAFPEQSPRVHKYATAVSLQATGTAGSHTLRNANFQGQPTPSLLPWFPTMTPGSYTGQYQAGWSVAGNGEYVVYGGEFPRVNGTGQQGLVRYALPTNAPNRVGPSSAGLTPTVVSFAPGVARVGWTATSDQDNENLTYRVYRDGDTRTPVYEVTAASTWWNTPAMSFTDVGVTGGGHTYRVSAVDPVGNQVNGSWTAVEVLEGAAAERPYGDTVRADGAQHHWPLGEPSGTTGYDYAGSADLTVGSGVVHGQEGAISGDLDTAYQFGGTSDGLAATRAAVPAPDTFTTEAWFRTTTTQGGKLIGFGSASTGISSNRDRHVYMDLEGRVHFGVYDGARRSINGSEVYNDGEWHHVVASLSPAGMSLYLDGALVGSRAEVTAGQSYSGYWRIGGDRGWVGDDWFTGQIDEVAIYPTALSAAQVADHHTLGSTGESVNVAPTAAFTSTVADLTASFDGSGSTDIDGTVESFAWDFGDGATGTGATATHTYAAAGTYTVTLTATDDGGATAARTGSVTVTDPPPNQAPTAAFSATAAGLSVSVDGTASADTDGTVASYGWDFGDGSTGNGAMAEHTYAAAGSYEVTLTVTDADGATGSAAETVTVTEAVAPPVLASDAFGRTISGGLGTADVGGEWVVSAGGARQSVRPGAAALDMTSGTNTGSYLTDVSQTSADLRTAISLSEVPTGGGAFLYVQPRRLGTNQEYRARVRVLADGTVRVAFTRLSGSASETIIGGEQLVPGLTYTAGTVLNLRVQAVGTGTTELAATVWAAGSDEPVEPTVTRTDSTASLQATGSVGLSGYLSGSATAPVGVRVTGFTAVPVGASEPAPENVAPTAVFSSAVAGLAVSFDGGASTDVDGSVASHGWDFGDGA
ncbi:PKD domain-containing protein, partial [Modestobacter sp. SYSU DS0985]